MKERCLPTARGVNWCNYCCGWHHFRAGRPWIVGGLPTLARLNGLVSPGMGAPDSGFKRRHHSSPANLQIATCVSLTTPSCLDLELHDLKDTFVNVCRRCKPCNGCGNGYFKVFRGYILKNFFRSYECLLGRRYLRLRRANASNTIPLHTFQLIRTNSGSNRHSLYMGMILPGTLGSMNILSITVSTSWRFHDRSDDRHAS